MKIKKKIVYSIVIISWVLIASSIICLISKINRLGQELLFTIQKDRLTSIRYFKSIEVETYFENLMENISTLANNHLLVNAFKGFAKTFPEYLSQINHINLGYKSEVIDAYLNNLTKKYEQFNVGKSISYKNFINLRSENGFALQYNYIFNNPYYLNDKEQLLSVDDGTNYSAIHKKYHPLLLAFKKQFGFHDILLVDVNKGDIIYTVNKEIDFTNSLVKGIYSKSNIGEIFKKVVNSEQESFIAVADFAPYLAYYDNPVAFIGVGVFDPSGNKIGVMIIQLSVDKINDIMLNKIQWSKIGLGKSINSAIVGSDYKLRTSNRFFIENREKFLDELSQTDINHDMVDLIKAKNSIIGILKTDTLAVRKALDGNEGFVEYTDYRNIPVISSFAPLKILGLNWVIIVKMDKKEALNLIGKFKEQIIYNGILIGGIFGVVAILLGLSITKSIVKYIYDITEQINYLAENNDLTKRLIVPADSEFKVMVNAFNNFVYNLQNCLRDIILIASSIHDPDFNGNINLNAATQGNQENLLVPEQNDVNKTNNKIDEHDKLRNKIYNLAKEFKIIENYQKFTQNW